MKEIHNMKDTIAAFADLRCLVIGDVMVDRYLTGTVSRQSPEAPVPILDLQDSDARLGGAANVALNLAALCKSVSICAVIGQDEAGKEFRALVSDAAIDDAGVLTTADRITTVKTRLMDSSGHLMRVDREDSTPIKQNMLDALAEKLRQMIKSDQFDVVLLQDYNKGLLQAQLIATVRELCHQQQIPIAVDPKFAHISAYQDVDIFKPNLGELEAMLGEKVPPNLNALDLAAEKLHTKLAYKRLLVTLSEAGIYYHDGSESGLIPAFPREIRDVCGAGDTVIAVAALALAAGQSLPQIAQIANLSGGIVCEFAGVQAISAQLLLDFARI